MHFLRQQSPVRSFYVYFVVSFLRITNVRVGPIIKSCLLLYLSTCYLDSGPKISTHSMSMNSTIWFWYSMLRAMFPASSSGHIRVGPKTMLMPWLDMRFCRDLVKTLQRETGKCYVKECDRIFHEYISTEVVPSCNWSHHTFANVLYRLL